MKEKIIKILVPLVLAGAVMALYGFYFGLPSVPFPRGREEYADAVVIEVQDFSIFLFESSEEIYRANVQNPEMWAGLQEYAADDPEYAVHYDWLYQTYAEWDERRRAQLAQIMEDYHPQPMSERLLLTGRQNAGLDQVIELIRRDGFFRKDRAVLADFYSWYGQNYALPHYQRIEPLLQRRADHVKALAGRNFDAIGFMEQETGINLKKRPDTIELLLNMRIIGPLGFYREGVSTTTIQWNSPPERIWAVAFHELGHHFFQDFTGSWRFRYLGWRLKKDAALNARYQEDVPYSWGGWIEENLVEGFARYLCVRKDIASGPGEGIYIFDQEYAMALLGDLQGTEGFDVRRTTLKDFTAGYLSKRIKSL